MRTIGVVGAGVIGACVAFCLAERGAYVHCVDPAQPGRLTTDVSFARLSAYQQPTYARFELSQTGMIEHARFAGRFGSAPWWHATGSVAWTDTDGGDASGDRSFAEVVDRLRAWGYQVERCDARTIRDREPGVVLPHPRTPVVRFPEEGWIDGPTLVSAVLAAAQASGRLTLWGGAVDAVDVRGGRVVGLRLENGDRIDVDAVVNAAGPGTVAVAAALGVPMDGGVSTRNSVVVDLVSDGDPVRHVLRGPDVHVRPSGPGRVRVRSEQVDARLPVGVGTVADDDVVEDLLERAHRTVPALATSTVDRSRIGTAVFPSDGFPSVGALSAVPGYFEAFANSGVTLAPFIGRTLATQILAEETHPLLARCSPERLRATS